MLWDRDKRALQERHSEARKATVILSDDIKYKRPEEWQTRFDKLGSNDENVLSALHDECESELKLNRSYQEKKQSMDTLTEEIAQLREDREAALKGSETISTGGVQRLKDLIDNVNDKFSAYFADLGYAGEVRTGEGILVVVLIIMLLR